MRTKTLLLATIGLLAIPSTGHAKCPADPVKASAALWSAGTVPTGVSQTETHPCGRKITCTGGRTDQAVRRSCR